jgi:hypothetical protein
MMDRRTLLATVLAPILPRLPKPIEYKVGDWIRVLALPAKVADWASSERVQARNWAWVYRKCVGKRYEVVIIGDGDGDDSCVYFEENTLGSCDFSHLHLEGDGELSYDDHEWLKRNKNHGGYYVHVPAECVVLAPVAEFNT